MHNDGAKRLEEILVKQRGQLLAPLIRIARGDFELAEDALQEAAASASLSWRESGPPKRPAAWLFEVSRRRLIDRIRKSRREREWSGSMSQDAETEVSAERRNDMLRLIFTCCHPALALPAQVALTLQTVGGLETEEIARAFLVAPATMAQRLVRAKRKIKTAKIPYRVPGERELGERVDAVGRVVYLIFNEGYGASRGAELLRRDLCVHALRLAAALMELLPNEPEMAGLRALMLLHHARAQARVDRAGDLILLEDQDRNLWDRAAIAEGCKLANQALAQPPSGPFTLQSAIAALHAMSPSPKLTDWEQIAALYERLVELQPTPVVALNRAVAVAMWRGPEAGLQLLVELDSVLSGYHLFHSARADLLRRLERWERAISAYERALALCENASERRFLRRRLEQCRLCRVSSGRRG